MDHRVLLSALGLLAVFTAPACASNTDAEEDDSEAEALTAGNPANINIGFNIGWGDEFDYYPDFFGKEPAGLPAKHLCHAYTSWHVGYEGKPDASLITNDATKGSRAALMYILQKAQGNCQELLISFKAMDNRVAPSEVDYGAAMGKFFDIDWKGLSGFTGDFAFTPWNEPNNPAGDGNGLGVTINPDLAARYYLTLSQMCQSQNCTVAAGDFASNGDMWDSFEINCQNDNVQDLCAKKSSVNKDNKPASYLDIYKNTISLKSNDYGIYGLPKYFAFHGWHDINLYLKNGAHCTSYDNCAERRILQSLGGSWGGVEIWDTETGVDQSATEQITDDNQACGAAFLNRLHAISKRITRVYYTRLHGGGGQLVRDVVQDGGATTVHQARAALFVLAKRQTSYAKANCQ